VKLRSIIIKILWERLSVNKSDYIYYSDIVCHEELIKFQKQEKLYEKPNMLNECIYDL